MRRLAWPARVGLLGLGLGLGLGLALAGCDRCGGGRTAVDAGARREPLPVSVDLRAAFFTLLPEFRGTRITGGFAAVEREVAPARLEALRPLLTPMGYQAVDGGPKVTAQFPPFAYQARAQGDRVVQRLQLPLGQEDLPKLLQTPAPLTSEHMGTLLPRVERARTVRETFDLQLEYEAPPAHAGFLVDQLVRTMVGSDWRVPPYDGPDAQRAPWPPGTDGGPPELPSVLELVLRRTHGGTEIHIFRDGPRVRLRYHQPLVR